MSEAEVTLVDPQQGEAEKPRSLQEGRGGSQSVNVKAEAFQE